MFNHLFISFNLLLFTFIFLNFPLIFIVTPNFFVIFFSIASFSLLFSILSSLSASYLDSINYSFGSLGFSNLVVSENFPLMRDNHALVIFYVNFIKLFHVSEVFVFLFLKILTFPFFALAA